MLTLWLSVSVHACLNMFVIWSHELHLKFKLNCNIKWQHIEFIVKGIVLEFKNSCIEHLFQEETPFEFLEVI